MMQHHHPDQPRLRRSLEHVGQPAELSRAQGSGGQGRRGGDGGAEVDQRDRSAGAVNIDASLGNVCQVLLSANASSC